jgi:hypothetical protein
VAVGVLHTEAGIVVFRSVFLFMLLCEAERLKHLTGVLSVIGHDQGAKAGDFHSYPPKECLFRVCATLTYDQKAGIVKWYVVFYLI